MRVFLDTNVLVSAFASRGLCADVLELVLLEHDLILGQNLRRELKKALRDRVKLLAPRSSEIVEFLAGEAVVVIEGAQPVGAKADADDALVLGEVHGGQAEMFVTGDAALLKLETVEGFRVVSPRQFWEVAHAGPR